MFDANGFEIEICGRCGGCGKHSYCERYGDRCFKCGGKGKIFTKRGAEARRFYLAMFQVPVESIKVGDWVLLTGHPRTKVLNVIEGVQKGWSNNVPYELPIVTLAVNTSSGLLHSSIPKGSKVKRLESESVAAERLVAAMEYQATLTKVGKVRKSKSMKAAG